MLHQGLFKSTGKPSINLRAINATSSRTEGMERISMVVYFEIMI